MPPVRHGPSCGLLGVRPTLRPEGPQIYGWSPNVSSWGGSIVAEDEDSEAGLHHLFVAEMAEGGLVGWARESQCVHAISRTGRAGPYHKADVAVGKWCHGPVLVPEPHTGEYLLFHVGSGPGQKDLAASPSSSSSSSSFMHHAKNLSGPWTPAPAGAAPPGGCNMPNAAFHPNGTLFAICGNGHSLTSTPDWRAAGSWARPATLDTPPRWEDPSLWFDHRGHWHIIYHVYALEPYARHDERYSGHAYSRDGIEWTFSDVEPFNGTVTGTAAATPAAAAAAAAASETATAAAAAASGSGHGSGATKWGASPLHADRSTYQYATRERPQLVFADASRQRPVALTSAVSNQPIGPACDSCTQGACSQCKITPGRDWTFTILQPLDGFTLV